MPRFFTVVLDSFHGLRISTRLFSLVVKVPPTGSTGLARIHLKFVMLVYDLRPEDIEMPIFTRSKRRPLANENQRSVKNGKTSDQWDCVLG